MRVLYLTQYFPPEIGATQTRAYEMAQGLKRAGHEVTILTEFPNHPTGIIPPEYDGLWTSRETLDGLDVFRVWVKTSPQKNFKSRMAFYLSYMFMAAWAGVFLLRGRYDALYATSPPLFVGGAALAISYLRRIPLFFEVRDLWPESAVQLGELNNKTALKLATWLEEACYRRARHIVVVTEGFKQNLVARGISAAKISVIPNGANTDLFQPVPPSPDLRRELGLAPEQFVVAYTGLHGLAHGLETVLHTAEILRHETDITFLLVGDGPCKPDLQALAAELDLPNVIFHPAVAEHDLPAYVSVADAGLDVRRKIGISTMTLPVKMFSYMACERPVLLAIEGEAIDVIEASGAGLVVPPEDASALAEAVLFLRDNPAQRLAYGQHGRDYVTEHYSRQKLAARLTQLLQEKITPPS